MTAGCVAILLVYAIGRVLWDDKATALWGAGIYSLCRLLYFPAMIARPDMLCGTPGAGGRVGSRRWSRHGQQRRWLALAGVFLGLAGLTHPSPSCSPSSWGLWTALAPGATRALLRPVGLAAAALATFSTWLILIVRRAGVVPLAVHHQYHRTRQARAGSPAPVPLAQPRGASPAGDRAGRAGAGILPGSLHGGRDRNRGAET